MAGSQVNKDTLETCGAEELIQGGNYNLLAALTHWADPSDPCAASRSVMKVTQIHQVLPMWLPEAGDLLVQQVEQAVASKSPGIHSLVELLKEYAKSRRLEEVEEDGDSLSATHLVKGYALLCDFPTRDVALEEGGGKGFNCFDFVRDLTYLFNLLLENSWEAVARLSCLVGESQLRAVVDTKRTMFLRRTTLKDLNELLIHMDSLARGEFKRKCHKLFLKLPEVLQEVGDYDTQASVVELMYRMTTSAERTRYVTHWFPTLDCTIQCLFLTISEFDPHCRRFLNAYNASLGEARKVHTIPCHAVHIGKLKLCKPKSTSYPRFWIDFNLGSTSILILCQVEGSAQASDPWECLFIESEEVQSVTLTRRVHSYTLEVEYSNLGAVEDLFSSPLSMESRSLLSCVVFFEFSPHALLENLCTHLYGSKLTVIKLEPRGWRRKTEGEPFGAQERQTGTTSSSSCTWGRKYSGVVTDVDVEPDGPSEVVTQNGLFAHMPSTESSAASSRKHYKKSSAVSMVCDVDEGEGNGQAGVSGRPQKPTPIKRRKVSAVFLNLGPNEVEISKKGGGRGRGRAKSTRGMRKKVKASHAKCITSTALSPQCYVPLNFTSPIPGAAVRKRRSTHEVKVSTTYTEVATQEEEENQTSSGIERKCQPVQPGSEHSKMHEKVMNEVRVILPSSEESLAVDQNTEKATSVTCDVPSVSLNTEEDPDSGVKITETTPARKHKIRSGVTSGVDVPRGSDSELPNTQTDTVAEKKFKQTKMNTSLSKHVKSGTNKPAKPDATKDKPASNKTAETVHSTRPEDIDPTQREAGSVTPHEADPTCSSKPGTPTLVEMDHTPSMSGSAKPVKTQPPQVKPHSTKPVVTSHTHIPPDDAKVVDTSLTPTLRDELSKAHPAHDKPDSPKPHETDPAHSNTPSPIKEDKPDSPKPHETDPAHSDTPSPIKEDKPDSPKPHETDPAHSDNPSPIKEDKPDSPKPHETDPAHSNTPSPKESPLSAGEICDEELFDFNPSWHQEEVTTQPFTEAAATTAKTALPTPPQSSQPIATVCHVSKDVHDRHTLPETVQQTPHVRSTPLPEMTQKENMKDAVNDSSDRSTFAESLKKKVMMSPFLSLAQVEVITSPHDKGGSDTARDDPVEVLGPQEEDSQLKGDADKSKERSITNCLSDNTNSKLRYDELQVIQEVVALDNINQKNADRPRDKSATRHPEQLHQNHHQQSSKKGAAHRHNQSRRVTPQDRTPKKAYPLLHKLGDVSPARKPSTGRIRNKRKLFDPTTQSNVEVNLLQMPQAKKPSPGTFENSQDSKTSELEHKTDIDYLPPDHNSETTDKIQPQSNKKKRRVSKSEASGNTRRYSRGKGKTTKDQPPPPRRLSGFMEDSGLEEEPHSIYSDLESSPVAEVDSWYLQRIEKVKHNIVTYHNTSSRKSFQRQEKDQKVKKRTHSKDSKTNSASYISTSSAIEGDSDDETCPNLRKKTCSTSARSRDATEHIYNYSSSTNSPERKATRMTSSLQVKTTSTSEVSQTSSHDEWEPPSSKKKQPLSRKEKTKLAATRSRGRRMGRRQRWSKDDSSLDKSQKQMENTFIDSAIPEDNSEFLASSLEILRHTSRSSVDSGASNFTTLKLAASKGNTTDTTRIDSGRNIKCSSVTPQIISPEPQKSVESQTSSSEHRSSMCTPHISSPKSYSPSPVLFTLSPLPLKSPPVLHISTPALTVLSAVPQIDSPAQQELCIQPATEDLHSDSDTNQPQQQNSDTPDTHHHPSSSDLMPTVVQEMVASTQPFDVGNSPDLPDIHHPSQTLNTMDISAIMKPGSDTQAPLSGPLQSTMLDSLLGKSKIAAPRFSYVSEAETSYVNHEELTVVRDETSETHRSPSINDPIKAELKYDRYQTPSLTTITTTADVHQADTTQSMDDEPLEQSGLPSSEPTESPHKSLQTELPPHPSDKASRSEVKEQERPQIRTPCVQPSLVHPVTPTVKVPPQSTRTSIRGSSFSSRMYRQLVQDLQQTPLSSRHEGSPVRPQSKNLFGAVRREAASNERMKFSILNVNMLTALMAVKADLERMSNSTSRLAHTLGTVLTLYMEQLSDDRAT